MSPSHTNPDREDVLAAKPEERLARIVEILRRQAAGILEAEAARLPAERSLIAAGLDSLVAAELAGAIEAGLGVQVPFAYLLEGPSLAELDRAVVNRLRFQVAADLLPDSRALQRTRLGFDVSVVEVLAPLWAGPVATRLGPVATLLGPVAPAMCGGPENAGWWPTWCRAGSARPRPRPA